MWSGLIISVSICYCQMGYIFTWKTYKRIHNAYNRYHSICTLMCIYNMNMGHCTL